MDSCAELGIKNSTEEGHPSTLYYLKDELQHSIFPRNICPYTYFAGRNRKCPGLENHKFSIKSMETYYDEATIKEQLVLKKSAMTYATKMVSVTHYYPCIGELANQPECQINKCTLCPPELPMATCCVRCSDNLERTQDGEFIAIKMVPDGGHAMLLVGYNDLYQTRDRQPHNEILDTSSNLIFNTGDEFGDYYGDMKIPNLLKCINENVCNPAFYYVAKSIERFGDNMIIMCFK
ncbi:hypothetical protein THRCLA_04035 [Thraustotheca clavata]|uniref:Uncharacterized protein n=1 Tax=Thraustotheca clavata TaxID=74557 RepID=A0A1W0A0V2_9STRA|nr:hypothetical protein THRCLA_04035 [Thraustotheca clavata]